MPTRISDTSVDAETRYRHLLMERSGAERLRMACDMFDDATALVCASFTPAVAGDPIERRVALLERRYWTERHQPWFESVVAALRRGQGERSDGAPTGAVARALEDVV